MGNPKQKWTAAEEEALKKGIDKHGTGKWKVILRDPEFNLILYSRSNIDLKDKWRNMGVFAGGQRPRDKSQTPNSKPRSNSEDGPFGSTSETPASTCTSSSTAVFQDATPEAHVNDFSRKGDPMYTTMIFEALSALKDPNGSMPGPIFDYIKERHDIPPNFRRHLSGRLRKLAAKGKLEKIQCSYKLKTDTVFVPMPPPSSEKNIVPPPSSEKNIVPPPLHDIDYKPAGDKVDKAAAFPGTAAVKALKEEDVAMDEDVDSDLELAEEFEEMLQEEDFELTAEMVDQIVADAASEIANAENKSFVAVGAVKEEERIAQMAVDTESYLQLATEIFAKCSRGEVVHLAIA